MDAFGVVVVASRSPAFVEVVEYLSVDWSSIFQYFIAVVHIHHGNCTQFRGNQTGLFVRVVLPIVHLGHVN